MMKDDILLFIGQCAKLRKLSVGCYAQNDLREIDLFGGVEYANPQLTKELVDRGWNVEVSLAIYEPREQNSDDELHYLHPSSSDDDEYW